MYSFRKLQTAEDREGRDTVITFTQPRFRRGQRHLIASIHRKTSTVRQPNSSELGSAPSVPDSRELCKELSELRDDLKSMTARIRIAESQIHTVSLRCAQLEELHRAETCAFSAPYQDCAAAAFGYMTMPHPTTQLMMPVPPQSTTSAAENLRIAALNAARHAQTTAAASPFSAIEAPQHAPAQALPALPATN